MSVKTPVSIVSSGISNKMVVKPSSSGAKIINKEGIYFIKQGDSTEKKTSHDSRIMNERKPLVNNSILLKKTNFIEDEN